MWVTTNLRQCLRGGGKGRNNRLHSSPFLGSPAGLPSGEPKWKPYGKGTVEEGGPHRSSGAQSRVEEWRVDTERQIEVIQHTYFLVSAFQSVNE